MSTKYQKPLTIPEGFPALLKGFTREILRAQVRPRSENSRGSLKGNSVAVLAPCSLTVVRSRTSPFAAVQPDNIYEFGARYFADLLEQSRGAEQSHAAEDNEAAQQSAGTTGDATGLARVRETAQALDLATLSAAELEPIILSE